MRFYSRNPQIHNLGNIGFGGYIHSQVAPFITTFIDKKQYNGRNIRNEIINYLNTKYHNPSVLDLCCGIGLSTHSIGIDTSSKFIQKANTIFRNKKFIIANAENYKPNFNVDVVTCMFSFHEMPQFAHKLVIENSLKIAKKEVLILDISPNYKSSYLMKTGEPYLLNYQKTIDKTMDIYNFTKYELIKNHVTLWTHIKINSININLVKNKNKSKSECRSKSMSNYSLLN